MWFQVLVDLLEAYANQTRILEKLQRLRDLPQASEKTQVRRAKQVQRRLNAVEQAELLERYLAGEKASALAKAFGVNRHTVAKLATNAGVLRSRQLTPTEIGEAVRLYAAGWSCQRIGDHLGRSHKTIWLALKREGVQLRDSHGRER